jgi:hypothetical protein
VWVIRLCNIKPVLSGPCSESLSHGCDFLITIKQLIVQLLYGKTFLSHVFLGVSNFFEIFHLCDSISTFHLSVVFNIYLGSDEPICSARYNYFLSLSASCLVPSVL